VAEEEPVSPRPRPGVGESTKSNRNDQRERLLRAIVERVAEGGYPSARVGDIAAHAGVSRATFYELFENKEECFLAAHRELADRLSAAAAASVAAADPERAIDAAFKAIVDFARKEPLAYVFITHEAMLAGPKALEQRDLLLAQLTEAVQQAHAAHDGMPPPDLPVGILLGGLIRVLGMRMRRGPYDSEELLKEMLAWVDCYRIAGRTGRRPLQFPSKRMTGVERMPPGALAPAPLPRGRHRLPAALVTRVQRERILHATADVIHAKGYEDTTVADIVARAGISREVFYSHFHSRSDAFLATHTLVFEQMMATAAGAFIASAGTWPERVWDSWGAATALVVGSPSLAHFAFVESYALGQSVSRRTDEAVLAFTVFLRDGRRYMGEASAPSATIPTAIAGAVMETSAVYIRRNQAEELYTLLPLMVYMILAPFLGADAATKFVKSKLRER
jgi:AcrR family transcriptional regulator